MSNSQNQQLEKQLWAVANVLRSKMNADEYKNYILGFIFYKYLSEKLDKYINSKLLSAEDFKFSEIDSDSKDGVAIIEEVKKATINHLGFFLRPNQLFSHIVKKGKGEIKGVADNFILEELKNVLNTIEQTSQGTDSEDEFKDLFSDVDLDSAKLGARPNQKNEVIVEVLGLLNEIDFNLEDSKSDLLGDAYEYLIGEFAAGAGKKGGEFYTPAQISRLLAQIVTLDKKRIRSVYDPTCGSGSLLLRIKDYVEVEDYYGQELNPTTYNLARMNMILHGVSFNNFNIKHGDTLEDDLHSDLKAEAIIANPPFSANWKSDTNPALASDDRFSQYGRLAPKGAADYAFVTHMIYHLADNGTMAIVLPHGALFRSGAEGEIRKYIIEKLNYLDAVIGLPANLFYGTSIPAYIMVFKKNRKNDEDVLFIDASNEFEKEKNQNSLTDENIKKIFETYSKRDDIDKYSHKAGLDEIKENDFNLNIPRYVDTFEEEEPADLVATSRDLSVLKQKEKELEDKVAEFCKELGIETPF
ncbi:MAG: type I restriction-modification system subunit M [Candidatus Dojkabacteria bacterium]|nr:type I restriction-modification system subunit M [Candidatus Dojkabacteria bacterium]MDQ7020761.1 type I restriction-modification system subunit M [Candidatus Dojkabacteria bacterium]